MSASDLILLKTFVRSGRALGKRAPRDASPRIPVPSSVAAALAATYNPLVHGHGRGAGVVDRDGLENRCTLLRTVGSNPTLSANLRYTAPDYAASPKAMPVERG